MDNKHTTYYPGPWEQDGLYIDGPDGALIATVHCEDSRENESTGRLIAAAPALLEALQAMCPEYAPGADATPFDHVGIGGISVCASCGGQEASGPDPMRTYYVHSENCAWVRGRAAIAQATALR